MTATTDSTRARRYLLGEASDEECAVIEQEYLNDEEAIDLIASAEDDLIEDYLANNLNAAERGRFEQGYLASPQHRVRVETIRRLMAEGAHAAAAAPPTTLPFQPRAARRVTLRQDQWLALAATLLVAASIGYLAFSMANRQRVQQEQVAQHQEAQQPRQSQPSAPEGPAATPAPRVFALSVSPVSVRSATDDRPVTIPADTEIIAIRLEREAAVGALTPRRASIRTIAGTEVWQGAVTPDANAPRGTIARLDVPADKLPADDYLITLYGATRTGAEREWAQYFLRVRKRTP